MRLGRTKLQTIADGMVEGKSAAQIGESVGLGATRVKPFMDMIRKDEEPSVKGMLVNSLAGMVGNWGLSNDEIAKRIPDMSTDHLLAVNALSSQRVLDAATISNKK